MQVAGSVVLVTGASAGIGRATALALHRAGARVAMTGRRRERLEENAAIMRDALVVPVDFADSAAVEAAVDRTIEHYGRLDVLINNAGVSVLSHTDALTPEAAEKLLDVNFIAAVVATNRALPAMRRQHRGLIINVGSPGGMIGVPMYASYAASKAAMHAWTRSLQAEWAGSEIFVSEYQPGVVSTEIHAAAIEGSPLRAQVAGIDFNASNPSRLFRSATEPIRAEKVAADLVECVRQPRLCMYSSRSVRIGCAMASIDAFRLRLVAQLAQSLRRRSGLSMFSDEAQRR
jgi:NADP-dependent 3-hydroxy acid dehydrogenase YdfG